MKKCIIAIAMAATSLALHAQTLDIEALSGHEPSVVRRVWEVARHVKLDGGTQQKLAEAFAHEDSCFVAFMVNDNGVQSVKARNKLAKMHDNNLAKILTEEQLEQYYRGYYDAEANAEGIAIADRLQKKYNLTDQNWKFIRIAFYKIGLDSRMIKKVMADKPREAAKRIAKLREEQLSTIEAKGGIRVDPEGKTVKVIKPFDPNALHAE